MIEISVDDDEIVSRLSGRRVHESSGRMYHVEHNPPQKFGVDDETGEPLIQREDDQESTVRNRLSIYHQQTKPLVNFYTDLAASGQLTPIFASIDGLGLLADVQSRIVSVLG